MALGFDWGQAIDPDGELSGKIICIPSEAKYQKAVNIVFLAAALLIASTLVVHSKDITRGCKGTVNLRLSTGDPPDNRATLGLISGQGRCGSTKPNKCRERAKAQVDKCIDAMWRDRHKNAIAPECNTLVQGRTGAKLNWDAIYIIGEPGRLTARMAFAACCILRPSAATLQMRVGGVISGDKKCGSLKTHNKHYQSGWSKQTYDMDCDDWRTRGICTGGG